MKKYIIAGTIGFLIHAAWIVVGIFLVNSWHYLNIYVFHFKNMDRESIPVAFWYALMISIVFALIFRVLFVRAGHGAKEKWFLSFTAGAGFHLAFWALVGFLWAMFSGFGF